MRFDKYHGAGNDFVVVDARAVLTDWSDAARKLCDRHFGVGADGLILVCPSRTADLRMRMFNPDGSEAEACGNGLRCFVSYAVEHGLLAADRAVVETLGGIRHTVAFIDDRGRVGAAEVGMGVPRFAPDEIPALVAGPAEGESMVRTVLEVAGREIPVHLVSMGNPHAVALQVEDVDTYPLDTIGPAVEHSPVFPARTNFEIARVLGPGDILVRVWERGAGETLACGSGACATAVAARLLGLCGSNVRIHLRGGVLTCTWQGLGHEVLLRGPVQYVFSGDWPD